MSESENLEEIAIAYRKLFADKVQAKINEADLICEHIFDLLGSGPRRLSPKGRNYQQIDWHRDFKSGYRWDPKTLYRKIRYGHIEGVDAKVPWELSRCQHLSILGQAYLLSKNKKYSNEFINQISDWIKNNPVGFGVNWKCTMDVAIRATNWLVAMEYFSKNGAFSQDFLNEFYKSVCEHGEFIRAHLEYSSKLASNHYIANIVGLFFISVYCPFFKKVRKWQHFALRELSKEIQKQVYPDGCNFEGSPSYHRLVLEMFFYAELLGERAGIKFPKSYKDRVRKMFEFSLYCLKPNGMIPQIGDNDSGRFLIFAKRPVLEHKYLLTLASIYYNDSNFKLPQFDFDEEAWVFGMRGKKVYDELPIRTLPLSSKGFPEAGWFVIRHNSDYCFISCGSNSQKGNGGHTHNDKLSFELMLNGQDIIVDPGTYVYTAYPKERNKFRSTKYHNTIKFNGYEQNRIPERDMFILPEMFKIIDSDLKETDNKITFQGEIRYLDLKHKRVTSLDKETCNWQIIDCIACGRTVNVKLMFHLSPSVFFDNGFIFSKRSKTRIASIEIAGHTLEKAEYDYSLEYGVKIRAECLLANIYVNGEDKTIRTHINKL